MSRSPVVLRAATVSDGPFLVGLWSELLRRADQAERIADVEFVITSADRSPEQRLVIAEYDGTPAGAVLLKLTTISPVNLEPAVLSFAPTVDEEFRRRGVGHALIEAAVNFAEELGVSALATAALSGSRDANRFMARLAFSPQAVLRVAGAHAVRSRLAAQSPAAQRQTVGQRSLGQVLAARRSARRSQTVN